MLPIFNAIINGDLVEEPYKGFTDEEKKERTKLMKELEKKVREKEEANAKIEVDVKEKEKGIDKYRKDLLQIRESRSKDHDKLKTENFSLVKFSLNFLYPGHAVHLPLLFLCIGDLQGAVRGL